MKALISNDDGITASGILTAKKAVEELCDTYVIAPETQQSGIEETYLKTIKAINDKPTANIILNGEKAKASSLTLGTRQ